MPLSLLAGTANPQLASDLSKALRTPLIPTRIERFPDGELHVELRDSVRGHDVFVLQSTSPPVDEHLMELLFIGDACRRAGAARITGVVPYFAYARQDRRAHGRETIGAHVVARLIESAGFTRIVAVDLHSSALEGLFEVPLEHLSAAPLLAKAVAVPPNAVIVAPDLGAVKLAEQYQHLLHKPIAVVHKARTSASEVTVKRIIGDVQGRSPLIVDDMISTAGTIAAAVKALFEAGCAAEVTILATHALLVGPATARLVPLPIDQLIMTDSVTASAPLRVRHQRVSLAPLLADAIARLSTDRSLSALTVHR